jgi:hypothetical protein
MEEIKMGYSHYWYRKPELDKEQFRQFSEDCQKLADAYEGMGLKLGNGDGEGRPKFTPDLVDFNGSQNCGHKKNDLISIPWPTANAGGINPEGDATGEWGGPISEMFGVTLASLDSRVCNGDCSYEGFQIPQVKKLSEYDKDGMVFDCCKTAFRPYDLLVIACLIAAKYHFGHNFKVSSDGEDQHWFDGKMLCSQVLGYGLSLKINEECELVNETVEAPAWFPK